MQSKAGISDCMLEIQAALDKHNCELSVNFDLIKSQALGQTVYAPQIQIVINAKDNPTLGPEPASK